MAFSGSLSGSALPRQIREGEPKTVTVAFYQSMPSDHQSADQSIPDGQLTSTPSTLQ
jgi:hypothetical protein